MNKEQVENYITELESMFELSELEEHSRNILKVGIYINKLQQENQKYKERIEYLERSNNRREDTIIEQRQEISDLEDNWDKLRKFIGECLEAINTIQKTIGNAIENYTPRILTYKQILDKMQELEQGSDSNE